MYKWGSENWCYNQLLKRRSNSITAVLIKVALTSGSNVVTSFRVRANGLSAPSAWWRHVWSFSDDVISGRAGQGRPQPEIFTEFLQVCPMSLCSSQLEISSVLVSLRVQFYPFQVGFPQEMPHRATTRTYVGLHKFCEQVSGLVVFSLYFLSLVRESQIRVKRRSFLLC